MARSDRRTAPRAHLRSPNPAGATPSAGRRDRGIALVLVLWVLTLLTVMALGMTAAQRTETELTGNRIDAARFRALSDGAIAYAMYRYVEQQAPGERRLGAARHPAAGSQEQDGGAEPPWLPNGLAHPWELDGQPLTIAVFNEQSRINLNLASSPLLAALVAALGLEPDRAAAIADAIVDYRDEDDLKLLNGAEDQDYWDAGLPLGAKDAPFATVEELQQVLGVTPELYRLLAPEVTVDTDTDQVDQTFATAAVLAALQGISPEEAARRVEERDGMGQDGTGASAPLNRGGPRYRIQVHAGGPTGQGRTMEALVELQPDLQPPYRIRWRRYGLAAAPAPDAESTAPP